MESNLGLGAGSTSEMIIQTPSDDGGTSSILTAEALLSHLEILQKASKVVVEQDDVYVFPVYQADFSRLNLEYLFIIFFFLQGLDVEGSVQRSNHSYLGGSDDQ